MNKKHVHGFKNTIVKWQLCPKNLQILFNSYQNPNELFFLKKMEKLILKKYEIARKPEQLKQSLKKEKTGDSHFPISKLTTNIQ